MVGETQKGSKDSEGYLTQLALKDEQRPAEEQKMLRPRGKRECDGASERPQKVSMAAGSMGRVEDWAEMRLQSGSGPGPDSAWRAVESQ